MELVARAQIGGASCTRKAEADLPATMASRTTIDLAVGIIMGQNRCSQQEAFEVPKAASSHRSAELHEVATDVIATVGRGPAGAHFDA